MANNQDEKRIGFSGDGAIRTISRMAEMTDLAGQIAANLRSIQDRIAEAAARCSRSRDSIKLVGVTKYVGSNEATALLEAGCHDLGESRPQQLWQKTDQISHPDVRWHLVGHLQRNKIRRTLPLVSLIHSVDSERLLSAINQTGESLTHTSEVLLEVNISGDDAKHGFAPDDLTGALPRMAALPNVRIRGLMAMASLHGGQARARDDFLRLHELRERLRESCPPGISLDELSMGMSNDFEVAIEAGATLVRVGSALFEGLSIS